MKNFLHIAKDVDVTPLLLDVQGQPQLWNQNTLRTDFANSPHRETPDIWIRYNDLDKVVHDPNARGLHDEHFPVWYPSYYALPHLRPIIFALMARVEGEVLGGVLLYNVPAGKQIYPHVDTGWHVDYYDKFNVCLQSNDQTGFYWEDGEVMVQRPGDIHFFVNNKTHWVKNEGVSDHIIATICIRTHRCHSPS